MRPTALALVLFLLLTAVFPTPLRADDDDLVARLEKRVDLLLDVVADLQAEIDRLHERVAALEAAAAAPQDEAVIVDPVPEQVVVRPAPKVPGTYALDRDATVAAMVERFGPIDDETYADMMKKMVEEQFASVTMRLEIRADGSFSAFVEGLPGMETADSAVGTWKTVREVKPETAPQATSIVLTTTHENGEATEEGDVIGGMVYPNGQLRLMSEDEEGEFVLIFARS